MKDKGEEKKPDDETVEQKKKKEATPTRRILATLSFGIGCVLMFGADIQKHFVLKARPGLITDGFFALCRHPNYLGEMLLYGAFASLTIDRWEPWAILGSVWTLAFGSQIFQKEARMSRHQGWAEYKSTTAAIIPFLI